MKKVLSMLLCFALLVGTSVIAPMTVSAVSDYTLNFQTYAQGATNTGWTVNNAVETTATVTADKTITLTAKLTANSTYDPIFFSPTVNLPSTAFDTIKVGFKWTGVTGGVSPQLFFLTDTQTAWAAGDFVQSAAANTATDSSTVTEFTFNMAAKLGWKGQITKFRFDPADKAGTYELSYVTFVSNGKAGAVFLKNGATGGTAVAAMSAVPGTDITLPANTYTRPAWIFMGWNDGTTTYPVGATYTLTNNTTFNAVWTEDTTIPIVGKSWEFNTAGSTEGWSSVQKITGFAQSGGYLVGTASGVTGTTYDSRIASASGIALNPIYSIMKFRVKNVSSTMTPSGGTFYFTRTSDGSGIMANSGPRTASFSIAGNTGFVEYTVDLSGHASWTSEVSQIWLDCLRGDNGSTMQLDYIRFYRKGANTINYDKNTTDTVTSMPVSDTKAAKGTGYMLSGQTPSRTGYTFLGWSATPTGSVITSNAADITQSTTTFYAQWRQIQNVTASFVGGADITGSVDPITVQENNSITLPQNGFAKSGQTFVAWTDGTTRYNPGATYAMGTSNVTFYPVWYALAPTFSTPNGATNVDYRNFVLQITFPVDMDANTVTKDNISSTWVQNVVYNASTKTATIYLKPDNLKYSTTVSFTTSENLLSADHLQIIPATAYSFTTLATQAEDGENLITNGDFEQPYVSSFGSTMALSTDTPSGSGHSLQMTATGNYTQSRYNVYVKPGSVYQVEYDAKVLGNIAGDAATKVQVLSAFKMQAGNDLPFNGPTAQGLSDGWKHISFYTKDSVNFPTMTTGNTYMFIYSNPYNNSGTHYLLDNVSMKEAYPITFSGGTIDGYTITGSSATAYRIKNASFTLPAYAFSTNGYTQTGWTDGTTSYAAGQTVTVPIGGKAFTAEWTEDLSASFADENGAEGTAPATIFATLDAGIGGANIALPANTFTRAGYTFKGWSDGTNIHQAGDTYKLTSQNTHFSAVWAKNLIASFIDSNGASGEAPAAVTGIFDDSLNGANITLPENTFTRVGYTFIGWSDGKATFKPGDTYKLTEDTAEFTALWDQNIFGKIGAQILSGTTAGSDQTTLRFLTGINRTDCTEVGFIISAKSSIDTLEEAEGSENAIIVKSTKVYNKVVAEGLDILPGTFDGSYILSLKITDIPNSYFGATFYATLYAKKMDGSVVYSNVATPYSVNGILTSIGG